MEFISKQAQEILSEIGIRGLLKSSYHSSRHTDSVHRLILHPNVITELSPDATIDITHRFGFGIPEMGPTHPNLGNSKFAIHGKGELKATATEGLTFIGPCSVLNIRNDGSFSIGDSYINSHARINCESQIAIGDGCAIGWNLQMDDSNHHRVWVNGEESTRYDPIQIRDNVFIGHDVTVKKGVTINEGAIVASESVVTDDVPAETLVAGTPAEVIKSDVEWT